MLAYTHERIVAYVGESTYAYALLSMHLHLYFLSFSVSLFYHANDVSALACSAVRLATSASLESLALVADYFVRVACLHDCLCV
jgi:hypothetical protein